MNKWYIENIEEGIRPLVRLLRDNGYNTQCSCGHEMFVECSYGLGSDISEVDKLLFDNEYEDYTIELVMQRVKGFLVIPSFEIRL